MKTFIFRAILLFPLCLLLVLAVSLIFHYRSIQNQSLSFEKELIRYYGQNGPWEREDAKKALSRITDRTVVVLGESSLVVPGPCDGSSKSDVTFPSLLEKRLKQKKLEVLNLGYCGDDSRGVFGVMNFILSHKKPHAFVFYFGHNDYSNATRDLLHRQMEFLRTSFWLKHLFFFLPGGVKFQIEHVARNTFEALLIKSYRLLNPLLYDKEKFRKYSSFITAQIENKIKMMAGLSAKTGVPVVFISPVGNLFYPPVGADTEVVELYERGLQEKNLSYLLRASDLDFFGYDQRVKSELANSFQKFSGAKVRVLNLTGAATAVPFSEYKRFFSDIFHLSPEGHAWILSEMEKAGLISFLAD